MSEQRKVLILSTEFPPGPGGIGSHAYAIAQQLSKRGWQVKVLSPQDYATKEEIRVFNARQEFSVLHLRQVPFSPAEGVYRLFVLWKTVRTWRPYVILASGSRAVWIAAFLRSFVAFPVVAVGHGTEFGTTRVLERAYTRWAFSRVDAVVCVSHFTKRQMERMGIKARLVKVIHNGADAAKLKLLPREQALQFRRRLGLEAAFLLLTVGNVTRRKGQDVVIRSLPSILTRHPNVHYLVVGLSTEQEAFQQLAEQLRVGDHVHFLGKLDDEHLLQAYNAADLFVMTSRYTEDGDFEGYGIAVIEAALFRLPAVVSGNSGLAEAVVNGETGVVVPPEDPESTAQAIMRFLENRDLLHEMSAKARLYALRECTWDARGNEYERLLRSVIDGFST